MSKESNVFVSIGDNRKAIDEFVASQGLCQSDIPALRAAAKRFVHLSASEEALPAEKRAKVQASRLAESQRLLAAIAEVAPTLKPRRTVSAEINEALRKHLAGLQNKPDVRTTFKDLSPDLSRLAR
jgi:hypothetical protein